jgi:hypothetical protein
VKNDKEHVEEVWQYLSTLSYTEKQNVINKRKVVSVYATQAYAQYVGTETTRGISFMHRGWSDRIIH